MYMHILNASNTIPETDLISTSCNPPTTVHTLGENHMRRMKRQPSFAAQLQQRKVTPSGWLFCMFRLCM